MPKAFTEDQITEYKRNNNPLLKKLEKQKKNKAYYFVKWGVGDYVYLSNRIKNVMKNNIKYFKR